VGIPCSTSLLFMYISGSFVCVSDICSSSLCLLVLSIGILKYHTDHCMLLAQCAVKVYCCNWTGSLKRDNVSVSMCGRVTAVGRPEDDL
jgi:hypothetical protein